MIVSCASLVSANKYSQNSDHLWIQLIQMSGCELADPLYQARDIDPVLTRHASISFATCSGISICGQCPADSTRREACFKCDWKSSATPVLRLRSVSPQISLTGIS